MVNTILGNLEDLFVEKMRREGVEPEEAHAADTLYLSQLGHVLGMMVDAPVEHLPLTQEGGRSFAARLLTKLAEVGPEVQGHG